MGMGASSSQDLPGGDLRLPTSGLHFSKQQLRSLNTYVDALAADDRKRQIPAAVEAEMEWQVQRIVDGAGQKDPRFRCCHVMALHKGKKMRSRSLEYLVTLDSLPTFGVGSDAQLQSISPGCVRLRLPPRDHDKWADFLTPDGFFCREQLVERWVRLVAGGAGARGAGGLRVLHRRASVAANGFCYLERASPPLMKSDRRLAIVEGASWVMIRSGGVEAKMMLAVRVTGAAQGLYTTSVPLVHPMAKLHYTSVTPTCYAAAVGTASCPSADRGSSWQLWHPTLEASLDAHGSDVSTFGRVASALNVLIDQMREGSFQGSLRALSRYAGACALRRRMLRCGSSPLCGARLALAPHASHHLLLVLDELLLLAAVGGPAGFVYPMPLSSLARRAGFRVSTSEAQVLRNCLQYFHQLSVEDIPPSVSESLEAAMVSRWDGYNREARSHSGPSQRYTRRQLRYIWGIATDLIQVKNMLHTEPPNPFRANLIQATAIDQEPVEGVIHILAIMLDQARDLYLNNLRSSVHGQLDKDTSTYRSKKWNKLKDYYDASSACLIDAVRRDPDTCKEDLSDPANTIRIILNWLQKGVKEDKKYLGPVMKPYLDGLFNASIENCWFLEEFEKKRCVKEYDSLAEFCNGVHGGKIEPCVELIEAAKKMAWAKALVEVVDRYRHIDFRLVFPTGDGMAISFPMDLPPRSHPSRRVTLGRRDKDDARLRLSRRCVLDAFAASLVGDESQTDQRDFSSRHENTEEIIKSVKNGNFWRNNTKPDIIPSNSSSVLDISSVSTLDRSKRRSRRDRPQTAYGFPTLSMNDTKTLKKKYHTLKNLVYTDPVESVRDMRRRPRSAGSTMRKREVLSRPNLMETLDFINSVKEALNVEESGASDMEDLSWGYEDEWLVGQMSPLNLLANRSSADTLHLALGDLVPALLYRGKFTALQELSSWLDESSEAVLFSLHRLARAARSKSSDRSTNSWRLPEPESGPAASPQSYRLKAPDYASGDEAPQPPPLPRRSNRQIIKRYSDYKPPNRIQQLERHLSQLELQSKLQLNPTAGLPNPNANYTGIINPIYDIKIPKDKFVKRSKSLGRSFSTKKLGLEITRHNLTLGHKSGHKTNDVMTVINGNGNNGLKAHNGFFQRKVDNILIGDTYRISKITVD